jgi:hypothetical protein
VTQTQQQLIEEVQPAEDYNNGEGSNNEPESEVFYSSLNASN